MQIDAQKITVLLQQHNGLDARSLAEILRRSTHLDIHKRDINPTIYGRPDLFERRGDSPPMWFLRQTQVPDISGTPRQLPPIPPSSVTTQTEFLDAPSRPKVPRTAPNPPPIVIAEPRHKESQNDTIYAPSPRPLYIVPPANQSPAPKQAWPILGLKPYTWQTDALDWWVANGQRGIVEAVTGTGKTIVGLAAVALAIKTFSKTLLLVPSIVLQEQWIKRIQTFLPSASIATLGGYASSAGIDSTHDVLIAVVNSAANAVDRLQGRYKCVVADECHRYGAATFRKALIDSAHWRLGLTATLERLDEGVDDVLKPYFSTATYLYDFDRATSDRVLASFVVANVGIELTPDERTEYNQADQLCKKARAALIHQYGYPVEVSAFMALAGQTAKTKMTFFGEGKLAKQYMSNFSKRIKVLAETPGRLNATRLLKPVFLKASGALVFTETIEMADNAASALRGSEIAVMSYHSGIEPKDRENRLKRLGERELKALVCVKALDEGVDVPDVDLGVIMSASHQKRQMIQRLGRIIRKKPDARYAVLVNMFAKDTSEDPKSGNHEGFFDAVENGADAIETFGDGCTSEFFNFVFRYLGATHEESVAEKVQYPNPTDGGCCDARDEAQAQAQAVPDAAPRNEDMTVMKSRIHGLLSQVGGLSSRVKELEAKLSIDEEQTSKHLRRIDELTIIVNKLQIMMIQLMPVKKDSKVSAFDTNYSGRSTTTPSISDHVSTRIAAEMPSAKPSAGPAST